MLNRALSGDQESRDSAKGHVCNFVGRSEKCAICGPHYRKCEVCGKQENNFPLHTIKVPSSWEQILRKCMDEGKTLDEEMQKFLFENIGKTIRLCGGHMVSKDYKGL